MCCIKLVSSEISSFFAGCGIVQHPETGNWQVWFSLYGTDVTCIFASPDRQLAESVAHHVVAECVNSYLSPRTLANQFIKKFQEDEISYPIYPLPLPCLEKLDRILKRQIFKKHVMSLS